MTVFDSAYIFIFEDDQIIFLIRLCRLHYSLNMRFYRRCYFVSHFQVCQLKCKVETTGAKDMIQNVDTLLLQERIRLKHVRRDHLEIEIEEYQYV